MGAEKVGRRLIDGLFAGFSGVYPARCSAATDRVFPDVRENWMSIQVTAAMLCPMLIRPDGQCTLYRDGIFQRRQFASKCLHREALNRRREVPTQLHEIGQAVAKRRAELDLTQTQLAKLAGLSRLTVNQLEAGNGRGIFTCIVKYGSDRGAVPPG
ncbi:helix-turn-helix transcriptional regulator [Burkholderia sp. BCC1999]|uniref:helix-turn-helix transcriptional regulator n=1 Tax=Burkholderia sp. BCC1999 TaxID=2817448 RepID=UPI002AC32606|nr:helix-turn-helix domain-containing protein [Burkholderia sp. BCC1999]